MDILEKPNIALLQRLISEAYLEGKIKDALSYAKIICQLQPSYQSFFDHALLAKEMSLYKSALLALEQAINLDPLQPDAHIEKALILYELSEVELAYNYILSLRHILVDATPWALLAVLAGELSHLNEAIFYATKAIKQQPDSWSYHARAIVHQMLENHDKASQDFQIALSLDPYNPELWNSYALFFEEFLAFDHALDVYNTAIENFELTHYFLYLNRAKVHHILDKKDLAIIDCQLALDQVSDNGDIWFLFGSLLHEEGDLLSALHAYNQSLRYIKKDASIHFCKAQLLEQLGNVKEAKRSYEKAIKFDPDNQEIRLAFTNFLIRYNLFFKKIDIVNSTHKIEPKSPTLDDRSLFP